MKVETVCIFDHAGTFAEDKDVARDLRLRHIDPAIADQRNVVIDFEGVSGATQSFVHALISESIRRDSDRVLDLIEFKNCGATVRKIVEAVCEYSQENILETNGAHGA